MASNTQTDVLAVDLEVNDVGGATEQVAKFEKTVIDVNDAINKAGLSSVEFGKLSAASAESAAASYAKLQAEMTAVANNPAIGQDLVKQLATAERQTIQLERTLTGLSKVDSKNRAFDTISDSAIRLQKEAANVRRQLIEIQSVDTKGKGASFLKVMSEDAETLELQLARIERETRILTAESLELKAVQNATRAGGPNVVVQDIGGAARGAARVAGTGIPFRAAGPVIVGAAAFLEAKAALDAAKDAEEANRVLRESASRVGISYADAEKRAAAFGERAVLSANDAQKAFAELETFADSAGRSDKLEQFQNRITDLTTARGIKPGDIGDVVKGLNDLSGPTIEKLLNVKPDVFFERLAQSLHLTTDQLTDAQKEAAIFDETLRQTSLHAGETERHLNTLAGQNEQVSKTFADLELQIGKTLAPLAIFLEKALHPSTGTGEQVSTFFVGLADAILHPFGIGSDIDVNTFIDRQAEKAAKDTQAAIKDAFDRHKKQITDAAADPSGSFVNFAISHFLGLDADKFRNLSEDQKDKAIKKAEDQADQFIKVQKTIFKNVFERGDIGEIDAQFSVFKNLKNIFAPADTEKLLEEFSAAASKSFKHILEDSRATLPQIRAELQKALASPELNTKDRNALVLDFQKAIDESVKAGKAKITELGKTTDDFFKGLFAIAGADNPFVKIFTDGEQAIEKTRIATAALSKDLQDAALKMTEQANGLSLFKARLDTALDASDLKAGAEAFRKQLVPTADDFDRVFKAFSAKAAEEPLQFARTAEGGFTQFRANPFVTFDTNQLINPDGTLGEQGTIRRDIRETLFTAFDANILVGPDGTLGPQGTIRRERTFNELSDLEKQKLVQQFATPSKEDLAARERLDRQLDVIRSIKPEDEEQRRAADRKIIGITQGLSPESLTAAERDAAAAAREREAVRLQSSEQDALNDRKEALVLQRAIDKNMRELNERAKKEGLKGIIRIINQAENLAKVSLGKRPTDIDTEDLMQQ